MKKLLITTLFPFCVIAQEINLDCKYVSPNGKNLSVRIMLDPSKNVAASTENGGRSYSAGLYTNGESYWFTAGEVVGGLDLRAKHTISRIDLSYSQTLLGRSMLGQCAKVEAVKTQI